MEDKAPKTPSTMRTLDKRPKVGRRGFLRGGGLAAIGVTVVPVGSLTLAPAAVYAQSFTTLGADTGKTLIRMARDIFPHDKLADKFYAQAEAPYDAAAAKDPALKALLTDGVATLNAKAQKRYGKPYTDVRSEAERVVLLKEIEASAFSRRSRATW